LPPDAHAEASCLYAGTVRHRRTTAVAHDFDYRVSFAFVDLARLGTFDALAPLAGVERRRPIGLRRRDYFGEPTVPLDRAVRDLVETRTGMRPSGPIRLLTMPRALGFGFNPLSLYWCYEPDGVGIACVVAEVTNIPWLERHCYVLPVPRDGRGERVHHFSAAKALHVSPFMPMEQSYDWTVTAPADRLVVRIASRERGRQPFEATLRLERRPLTRRTLARALLDGSLLPMKVVAAIHWQALRLRRKGVPFFPHPRHREESHDTRHHAA
jgi:DUF1365 family protein